MTFTPLATRRSRELQGSGTLAGLLTRNEFAGRVTFDKLLSGIVFTQGGTSPTGIDAVCNAELAEIRVLATA